MRLFVAVELSEAVKGALQKLQRSLARFDSSVRWMGPEQMHLTLKFLGEVPDADIPEVCAAATRAANVSAPFEMALEGSGSFPPKGPVRIVWAGLCAADERLTACQRACAVEYDALGFEPEQRAFTPHLTVGRVREGQRAEGLREAAAAARLGNVSQAVDTLCVFQSTLTPKGAEHVIISRHPLAGARRPDA